MTEKQGGRLNEKDKNKGNELSALRHGCYQSA
jgi:hypothetical protein